MGHDASAEAADGVGHDGLGGEGAETKGVEHGSMGAQVATPAHADGGEHGYGVAINPALLCKTRNEAERGTHGAERSDREGNLVRVSEAEEPLKHHVALLCQPGQRLHAFVGSASVFARGGSAKGKNHYRGADYQHTRNNSHANLHTRLTAVEYGIEYAHEEALARSLLFGLNSLQLFLAIYLHCHFIAIFGVFAADEVLHQSGAHNATAEGAEKSDEWGRGIALAHHKHNHQEAHAKGRAEVGERYELVFAEEARKLLIVGQGDDGGVVAEEGKHGAERGSAGQIEEGLHERAQYFLKERHHSELAKYLAQCASDHADGHQEEAGIDQEVIGGLHDSVHHIGHAHAIAEVAEDEAYDNKAWYALEVFFH